MAAKMTEKELNDYFSEIHHQLKQTYTNEESKKILSMLRQSAEDFCAENPEASLDEFKEQFGEINDIADIIIHEENSETVISKLDNSKRIKKLIFTILILAVICFCIETGLYIKSYIDNQNSIIHHEITVIE